MPAVAALQVQVQVERPISGDRTAEVKVEAPWTREAWNTEKLDHDESSAHSSGGTTRCPVPSAVSGSDDGEDTSGSGRGGSGGALAGTRVEDGWSRDEEEGSGSSSGGSVGGEADAAGSPGGTSTSGGGDGGAEEPPSDLAECPAGGAASAIAAVRPSSPSSASGGALLPSLRQDGAVANAGSLGHPESCKPCAFYCYSLRGCRNGAECSYCHLFHESKLRQRREEWKKAQREKRGRQRDRCGSRDEVSSSQPPLAAAATMERAPTPSAGTFPGATRTTSGRLPSSTASASTDPATSEPASLQAPVQAAVRPDTSPAVEPQRHEHQAQELQWPQQQWQKPPQPQQRQHAQQQQPQSRQQQHQPWQCSQQLQPQKQQQPQQQQHQDQQRQQTGHHTGVPGLEAWTTALPARVPAPLPSLAALLVAEQRAALGDAVVPSGCEGVAAAVAMLKAASPTEFFQYTPNTAVVNVGQLVELWPPAQLIFANMVFAVCPELPAGLVLDERVGLIHGRAQAPSAGLATYFVTACAPGDSSLSVKMAMVGLKVMDAQVSGQSPTVFSQQDGHQYGPSAPTRWEDEMQAPKRLGRKAPGPQVQEQAERAQQQPPQKPRKPQHQQQPQHQSQVTHHHQHKDSVMAQRGATASRAPRPCRGGVPAPHRLCRNSEASASS